ncbi:nitrate reductase molybdenum cofactor assembly chaperone [Mycolicibacillus koreensis]|uniref:nitrate reductase molybdenum cofactor assembly chaperone n=1 Tax=Mycolicibacillus koreensis TaxID=1069220 RepID=UPI00138D457B|nr:nitrate reductase molybdenum cofactor assembly chaperone [Mycolicibacillus koreensis]BBY56853.1 nitrate reductase molybdenum cofactor assembly chaperone [Mycolicibacillus koreensis]
MRLLTRTKRTRLQDRAVWQAASLLLAYPDEQHSRRLDTVAGLLEHLDGKPAELLGRTLTALRKTDPLTAATAYVDTFDMRRRATMYLTYWTAGDTRNRGMAMLAFSSAYRRAGWNRPQRGPRLPAGRVEFAATVDAESGRRLLVANRVPIDVLATALAAADSPYAHTIAAVAETLPAVSDQQVKRARELVETGPPTESVGLQPYSLTGPPREEG